MGACKSWFMGGEVSWVTRRLHLPGPSLLLLTLSFSFSMISLVVMNASLLIRCFSELDTSGINSLRAITVHAMKFSKKMTKSSLANQMW